MTIFYCCLTPPEWRSQRTSWHTLPRSSGPRKRWLNIIDATPTGIICLEADLTSEDADVSWAPKKRTRLGELGSHGNFFLLGLTPFSEVYRRQLDPSMQASYQYVRGGFSCSDFFLAFSFPLILIPGPLRCAFNGPVGRSSCNAPRGLARICRNPCACRIRRLGESGLHFYWVFWFYAVGQNLRYLFGDDYPPKIVYFQGFWDVDRGTGVLTHCLVVCLGGGFLKQNQVGPTLG